MIVVFNYDDYLKNPVAEYCVAQLQSPTILTLDDIMPDLQKLHHAKESYENVYIKKNGKSLPSFIGDQIRLYYSLINEGKSEVYAHAYAYVYVSNDYKPLFCEIYAEAYELATKHGMDSTQAYCFGDTCTDACDHGYEIFIDNFIKQYDEVWQREFYLKLICDEIRREENREIELSYLYYLKKILGLGL